MKALASLLCLPVFALACSDDTYIATNESLGGSAGASTGGGGSSGSGGESGSGALAGASGSGGSAGVAGAAGSPDGGGSGGSGDGAAECTPGTKQDLGTCQKCGTSRRTCQASGTWADPVCEDQKECNPGDKSTTGCSDPCAEKVCGSTCTFGACGKKAGAACLWENGSNWQCCGAKKWQYCSSTSCDWFACQDCPSNSSCYTKC